MYFKNASLIYHVGLGQGIRSRDGQREGGGSNHPHQFSESEFFQVLHKSYIKIRIWYRTSWGCDERSKNKVCSYPENK